MKEKKNSITGKQLIGEIRLSTYKERLQLVVVAEKCIEKTIPFVVFSFVV